MRCFNTLIIAFAVCIANAYALVPVPSSWSFTSGTGSYANIGFLSTGNFQIAGRPIQAGDAIGAFYASGQDTLCAGYLAWDGENFGFAVWGDDEFTTNAKEGFASGEPIVLKAWDGIEGRCLKVAPTMQFGSLTFQNNALAIVSSFVTELPTAGQTLPAKWNSVGNTGTSANIGFQTGGSFQVSGRPMQQGDAIGAFYISGGDTLCGGYLRWGTGQNGFVAWGDDEFTTSTKEGFASNETYIFLVWDSLLAKEFAANVTISYGSSSFQPNGMTIISDFSSVLEPQSQKIKLHAGWNLISFNTVLSDETVDGIFASPISDGSYFALCDQNSFYDFPAFGIHQVSAVSNSQAYHVYLLREDSISVSGTPVVPQNKQIFLASGWNAIPYLRGTPISAGTALATILPYIKIMQNQEGGQFVPTENINTLETGTTNAGMMVPGKGYMIYVSQACTLTYPAN
jgi:hypothetical protein